MSAWRIIRAMRALLNVLLLVGLISVIALTWDKPLRERVGEIPLVGPYVSNSAAGDRQSPRATRVSGRAAEPAAPPQSNGGWMWDPNHKTSLDRPAYNPTHAFTNHVYYVDNNGAKYWVDAQGQRHYGP